MKKQKCEIKFPEDVYIGDKITKGGIKPDESKIEAILNLPSQNKKDVMRLLGMYLYGKEIKHKSLEAIFAKLVAKASPSMQNSTLTASIVALSPKREGKLMFIADALLRAHLETTDTNQGILNAETEMQIHPLVANLPISEQKLKEFQEAAKADPALQTVAQLTKQGWPDHKNKVPAGAKPYWSFKGDIMKLMEFSSKVTR
ncbi:hypothetical protein ACROYT_G022191 [Oculina patagonica]